MKKLLALLTIATVCSGCKPTVRPICPEVYVQKAQAVKAQWHAGKLTTSAATVRLSGLDEQARAWADDHYVSDQQRLLLRTARK